MGIIPFQTNIFDIQQASTIKRNPLNGFWNRRKRIRNTGARKAAIGKIHFPLKKNSKTVPINK
jgi:hypothetical protein